MGMTTYYEKELYPLQDRVLKRLDSLKTPFYLTGGTALSRCHFNHRYSDGLDLFVNNHPEFVAKSEEIITGLRESFDTQIVTKTETYCLIQIDGKLKIDLVNDVPAHIGSLDKCSIYSKVDNTLNILSNKITAIISREEPKDVVDIWVIAKNEAVDWQRIFVDASSKAVGIFPPNVAEKLETFPSQLLSRVNWIEGGEPTEKSFKSDLDKIVLSMLKITKDG